MGLEPKTRERRVQGTGGSVQGAGPRTDMGPGLVRAQGWSPCTNGANRVQGTGYRGPRLVTLHSRSPAHHPRSRAQGW